MGLLKTAATVAVASSVHGRVQRRQQARGPRRSPLLREFRLPPARRGTPPATAAASLGNPRRPGSGHLSAAVGASDRLAQLKQWASCFLRVC